MARLHASDAAAYLAVRGFEMASGLLPESAARRMGEALGRLAHGPVGVRRELVLEQVAASFPDRPRAWVEEVARGCYRHFGRELCATWHFVRRPREVVSRLKNPWEVPSLLAQVRPSGGGCVLVLGHVGNWELLGPYLTSAELSVTAVVQPQQGPVERRISAMRRAFGVEPVARSAAPLKLKRALEEDGVVALVADQHAGKAGAPIPFLGRPASTFLGPARLALGCDVPLFFLAMLRADDRYELRFEHIPRPEDEAGVEVEMTRRWVAALERVVRTHPEQYFWFHRRWKLGSEDGAREPADAERAAPRDVGSGEPGEGHA